MGFLGGSYQSVVLGSFQQENTSMNIRVICDGFFSPQLNFLSLSATCLWVLTEQSELHTERRGCGRGEGESQLKLLIGLNYECGQLGSHNRERKAGSLDNCFEFWGVAQSVYEG